MKYFKYLIAVLLILIPATSLADTHNAASCSIADITSAVNASATGDIITVPTGSCTWAASYTIPSNKKLTIQGAGVGNTIITGTGATSVSLKIGLSGSRVTGFTFTDFWVQVGASHGFRIDHNTFNGTVKGRTGVYTEDSTGEAYAHPEGLIDNNTFINGRVIVQGGGTMNNTDWTLSSDLGTADDVIFVEDNWYHRTDDTGTAGMGNAIDGNYGSAYVFRYNTLDGNYIEAHAAGNAGGNNRGAKRWEIYGNVINRHDMTNWGYATRLKAGTGIMMYNDITQGSVAWNGYISLETNRVYTAGGSIFGLCDGSKTGVDGNEDAYGYPCRDQIGTGNDASLWITSPMGAFTQTKVPAYLFLNKKPTGEADPTLWSTTGNVVHENRDYYKYNASFNGTSGVGCGTLANRPACESGCTVGVAYWATDQSCASVTDLVGAKSQHADRSNITGTLYKLTSAGEWTAYWTPYTYPHPLREDTGEDETAPTLVSATINAAGTSLYLVFTESVTVNTNTGFVLTATGSPSLTYASGTGTATLVYTIGAAVQQSESGITLAYTTGANYIEDAAGNDLRSFTGTAVVNNSTQNTPPTVELTVTKTGSGCTVTSTPSGVNCGSTCTLSVDSGTAVTLSGWSENGWNAITYGGDCAANGTVTMNTAKECTATCTQVYLFP